MPNGNSETEVRVRSEVPRGRVAIFNRQRLRIMEALTTEVAFEKRLKRSEGVRYIDIWE